MNDGDWRTLLGNFETHLSGERGLAALTVRNYRTDLEPLREYMRLRKVATLKALDRYALRGYLAWLVELGYARSSIVRKLSGLRSFLKWLLSEKLIDHDPLPRRGVMKRDSRLPRFLSQEEAARLVAAPDTSEPLGTRDRALLELIYAAGLRVSEARDLDVRDLNIESMELRVTGKGAKQRIALMGNTARDALALYLSQGPPEARQPRQRQRPVFEPVRLASEPAKHPREGAPLRRQGRAALGRTHPHVTPLLRNTSA